MNLIIVYTAYQWQRIFFAESCQFDNALFSIYKANCKFIGWSPDDAINFMFNLNMYGTFCLQLVYIAFNINLCVALADIVKNPFNNKEQVRLRSSLLLSLLFIIIYMVLVVIFEINFKYEADSLLIDATTYEIPIKMWEEEITNRSILVGFSFIEFIFICYCGYLSLLGIWCRKGLNKQIRNQIFIK